MLIFSATLLALVLCLSLAVGESSDDNLATPELHVPPATKAKTAPGKIMNFTVSGPTLLANDQTFVIKGLSWFGFGTLSKNNMWA